MAGNGAISLPPPSFPVSVSLFLSVATSLLSLFTVTVNSPARSAVLRRAPRAETSGNERIESQIGLRVSRAHTHSRYIPEEKVRRRGEIRRGRSPTPHPAGIWFAEGRSSGRSASGNPAVAPRAIERSFLGLPLVYVLSPRRRFFQILSPSDLPRYVLCSNIIRICQRSKEGNEKNVIFF